MQLKIFINGAEVKLSQQIDDVKVIISTFDDLEIYEDKVPVDIHIGFNDDGQTIDLVSISDQDQDDDSNVVATCWSTYDDLMNTAIIV